MEVEGRSAFCPGSGLDERQGSGGAGWTCWELPARGERQAAPEMRVKTPRALQASLTAGLGGGGGGTGCFGVF